MTAAFDPNAIELQPKPFLKAMHVLQKTPAIYVNNPKVACSTIKLALQRAQLGDPTYQPDNVHYQKESPLLTHPQLKIADLSGLIPTHFTFSFVRSPYKRLQSAYLNKVVTGQKNGRFRRQAGFDADEVPSFAAFVRAITTQDPPSQNPHWRAQSINLCVAAIPYDFIGHLERFDSDWSFVAQKLDLAIEPARAGRKTDPVQVAYTEDTAALVRQYYARDFECFGYDPQDVPKTPS